MSIGKAELFQGQKIEVLEMLLKNVNNQFELSWLIYYENSIFRITFSNVSGFRLGALPMPLEIHGFEIINHSQSGWEKDSAYEIRDFEDDLVNFFCEHFEIDE